MVRIQFQSLPRIFKVASGKPLRFQGSARRQGQAAEVTLRRENNGSIRDFRENQAAEAKSHKTMNQYIRKVAGRADND